MMGWRDRWLVAIRFLAVLGLALGVGFGGIPSQAQELPIERYIPAEGEVPEVGSPVLVDPLDGSGPYPAWTCPTGRNVAEPVGEGYILKVTGKCEPNHSLSVMGFSLSGVTFLDGEVRLDVKIVTGHDRGIFIVGLRQGEPGTGYEAGIVPAHGSAALVSRTGELAVRTDLAEVMVRDDWNSVAIRARGPDLWLLVNDQPIATASDPRFDNGRISFGLRRLGSTEDEPETAAVIRNLRISRLLNGDPTRVPVVQ
jgi:hypothetical protein